MVVIDDDRRPGIAQQVAMLDVAVRDADLEATVAPLVPDRRQERAAVLAIGREDGAVRALEQIAQLLDRAPGHEAASSFALMQVKVWAVSLFAVPSMRRAPTEASVPAIVTSADQSIAVPPSAPSRRAIDATASAAEPGACPWTLMTILSGACCSTISMSPLKRAEMNPTPTLATAL